MTDEVLFDKDEAVTRLRQSVRRSSARTVDCGRDPASVRLIAVSKTFLADEVWPTIAAGDRRRFGENRVQEAQGQMADLRARAAGLGKTVELHLIGPLQSNKAREAVETLRRHRDRRSRKDRRRPRRSDGQTGKRAAPVRAGQYGRGAAEGRSGARARPTPSSRCAATKYGLEISGTDVYPAGRRAGLAAFRASRHDRQTLRNCRNCRWG